MVGTVNAPVPRRPWFPYAAALVIVLLSMEGLRLIPRVSAVAVAPVFLLFELIIARAWGIGPALLASATASLSYSYYFLPPAGFGIENPNDWIAFVTFTVTAVIVGELSARAKRRQNEAQEGRREIERLYQELQAAFDRASEAEATRRNEQLKAALLDALTHNLRTPLTSIKASVTALLGAGGLGHSRLSSEGERELLEVIDEETDRLNRFIEGLSTAGSADGSVPLNVPPVGVEAIVRAGLERAETLTRDHRVVEDIEEGMPPVAVDAAAVTEALYILLDNASKYAAPRTTIRVSAEREDARHVRVAVTDLGPGIAPEYRERVFENFFRIPGRESRDPRRVGVGLGLPIARRLIASQAGRMWIDTPPSGRGAMIAFTLPVSASAEAPVPGTRVEGPVDIDRLPVVAAETMGAYDGNDSR
jgi:two-component system sensor histidine kinase KdpD